MLIYKIIRILSGLLFIAIAIIGAHLSISILFNVSDIATRALAIIPILIGLPSAFIGIDIIRGNDPKEAIRDLLDMITRLP